MADAAEAALDALGDPTRRRILDLLGREPRSITGLSECLPVSRPAVSKHLVRLRAAGLVTCKVEGARHVYALQENGFAAVRDYLDGFWPHALRRFKSVAENLGVETDGAMSQDAVIHSLSVAVGRTRAFEVWVGHIDLWWPKSGHSRSGDPATTVCFDCAAGGRFFERTSDGREITWGTIEAWEPPNRIAFTWWMGADAETATQVEVTFAEGGPGLTEVVVRHSAGRMAAADWADLRDDFRRGFAAVIRAYDGAVRTEGGIP